MNRWRGVAVAVVAGSLLTAAQAPAFAAGAAAPTITIGAASLMPVVNHDVLVAFRGGKYSKATVSGQITGAADGELVTLYAQRFPYTKPAVPVGSITISGAGSTTPYSFTVRPTLATRYQVKLSRSGSALAASGRQLVYVTNSARVSGVRACSRPVCHETVHVLNFFPPSSVKSEMRKRIYPYLGVRRGSTTLPKWLYLNGGHARVTTPKRVSASEFKYSVHYTFTVGTGAYWWLWAACIRDTVNKNGVGLPGPHVCGHTRMRSDVTYLG